MTETGIQTAEVAEYSQQHQIETVLTDSVNEILRTLPPDPFSSLISILKDHSKPIFTINSIKLINQLCQAFNTIPSLSITMSYKGNKRDIYTYQIPFTAEIYEKLKDNFDDLYKTFEDFYEVKFINYSIESIEAFDMMLTEIATTQGTDLCRSLSTAISLSCFYSMALMVDQSLNTFIKNTYPDFIINNEIIPNIGFSLFKTGKTMNSKVKFEHFILFINNQTKMEPEAIYDLINKIYTTIRKFLTQGKQGENGMRLNKEGSYYPPQDTLNDILKLIENIINEVNEKDALYIGIDCNANNYYNPTAKTYEMDGFKKPPDTDQLIDFYLKLVTDHPLITYLEEPIASEDNDGWEKIMDKFEEKPNIKIYSKSQGGYKTKKDNNDNVLKTEPIVKSKRKSQLMLETLSSKLSEGKQPNTEENKPRVDEEEENEINCSISYKIGEISSLSEMIKEINALKEEGEVSVTIWDNEHETNNSIPMDIALGLRVDNIILNGLTMREDKVSKIIKYLSGIKELY